VTVPTEGDCVI